MTDISLVGQWDLILVITWNLSSVMLSHNITTNKNNIQKCAESLGKLIVLKTQTPLAVIEKKSPMFDWVWPFFYWCNEKKTNTKHKDRQKSPLAKTNKTSYENS